MPTAQVSGPSYLPSGYTLSQRVEGADAGGLGQSPNQVGLFYRRGTAQDDWHAPLAVFTGPPGASDLVATENHPGEAVDLGVPGITATYHDGMWTIGAGPDQTQAGSVTLYWDTSTNHSITIRWSGGTAAIRGPKARGVGYDELTKMASSLFSSGGTSS
jgi:hypothetical protein